jgi:uncharacterized membrane protein YphA (DoxX/SURF4 family)
MFEAFFRDKFGPLVLRLALGFVAIYHGYLKIAANGGTAWMPGVPVGVQLLLSWGEFAAGVAILAGYRCRLAASIYLLLSVGLLVHVHGAHVVRLPLRTLEPLLLTTLLALGIASIGAGEWTLSSASGSSVSASSKPSRKRAAA